MPVGTTTKTVVPFSVVISTRNRPADLERCLRAVASLRPGPADVLVADNCPNDSSAQRLAERAGARYLLVSSPGMSRARNVAARSCASEFIAFLDDDAVPESSWLAALSVGFSDARIMAVAGRILPLWVRTEAEQISQEMGGFESAGATPCIVDKTTPQWFEIANFGGIGSGANVAFRRNAFDFWPGFDERIGRGKILNTSEENGAFFWLIDAGYRIAYTPDAVVRHPFPSDMATLRRRCAEGIRMHVGYITLLWFEHPAYRRELVRYVVTIWKGRRTWRPSLPGKYPRVLPRWRVLFECLRGPLIYGWSRIADALNLAGRRDALPDPHVSATPASVNDRCENSAV